MLAPSCLESPASSPANLPSRVDSIQTRIEMHSIVSREFVLQNKYDTGFCFLVDLHRPSGDNRFLVYNLPGDSIEMAGKVAHGRCNEEWLEIPRYSNSPGTGCSSLGKYRIGQKYFGQFGLAYKLYGLDSTNSNAYKRNIVLHAHDCVPEANDPATAICQSDGCVMVSPRFLQQLKAKLASTSLPVLLLLYSD
jgi:hypothetical protein